LQIIVRVKPNARKPGISIDEIGIEIRVNEPAQDGLANEAARASLAEALNLPRSRVTLTRGARSKEKAFTIDGLDNETIRARLNAYRAKMKRS
jgi:uncharacterized protein YggU (UPF0235/DUF167 family)